LHDAGPGKELGDGTWAEKSVLRGDGNFLFVIGIALPLSEEQLAVFDYCDDGNGDIGMLELQRHQAVEKSIEVGSTELGRTGGEPLPGSLRRGLRSCSRNLRNRALAGS